MIRICEQDIHVTGSVIRKARLDSERYESVDDPQALVKCIKGSGVRIDLFTFLQIRPETSPQYPYPWELDNLAILPVISFDQWWKTQIRSLARNRARQAEKKGVILREVPFDDDLVRGIWEIYNECPVRQGRRFPHYGRDLETVRREAGTFLDSSIFIGAFLDNRLIGFIKMTCDQTRTQANLMSIIAAVEHRDKAPTNALIAHAVRVCAERGITHLVYQHFSYGKRERDSLSDFKESNGFQRVDVPRYYVPLTAIGRAALHFGLHHRLIDHCPESIIEKVREFRTAWYTRKLQTSARA